MHACRHTQTQGLEKPQFFYLFLRGSPEKHRKHFNVSSERFQAGEDGDDVINIYYYTIEYSLVLLIELNCLVKPVGLPRYPGKHSLVACHRGRDVEGLCSGVHHYSAR